MEEIILRSGVSVGIFLSMSAWEFFRPRRRLQFSRKQRWPVNLGLAVFNNLLLRFSVGAIAYQSAVWAAERQFGVLHALTVPHWLAVALTLLLLDVAIYAQHIAMHKWRWLWRMHQVHHTDLDFDTSTAIRFHPLEIMLSMFYKVMLIVLLGADPMAVVAFEIILNGCALFNHGNVDIPPQIDRLVRWLIITPDMHRIHHSAIPRETDSNYGFSLSCWDRLFGTYTAAPQQHHTAMTIGLAFYRNICELGFLQLLALPFRPLRKR